MLEEVENITSIAKDQNTTDLEFQSEREAMQLEVLKNLQMEPEAPAKEGADE